MSLASASPVFGETDRFVERDSIAVSRMSAVVRAFDKDLLRDVAIKVLPSDWSAGGLETERFIEEARISGQLEHPYIVPIYEFGTDNRGGRFLCMKLVRGERLEQVLDHAGPSRLDTDKLVDLLQVFAKVCDAVSFAHSRGVIHRDIKPSNVMLGDFGQVYLMDWGIARPSRSSFPPDGALDQGVTLETDSEPDPPGALIGTPCYMAPEQLKGLHDQVDERTDVFGLGATLYEILTGQPPRLPENVALILRGQARFEIAPPERIVPAGNVPVELSRIALKAMAHDPEARYQTVNELKTDIERFQRGAWHLPRRWIRAGTLIVAQGEPGEEAFIIVEGRCSVFRTEEDGTEAVLREMGSNEVFGEAAVFSNKPRSASIRALTDVVLMVVTTDILSKALGLNLWMGSFVKALAERFLEVDEKLRQLEQGERKRPTDPE